VHHHQHHLHEVRARVHLQTHTNFLNGKFGEFGSTIAAPKANVIEIKQAKLQSSNSKDGNKKHLQSFLNS
jgi:hypothetical protein